MTCVKAFWDKYVSMMEHYLYHNNKGWSQQPRLFWSIQNGEKGEGGHFHTKQSNSAVTLRYQSPT